eukprot:g28789.t1
MQEFIRASTLQALEEDHPLPNAVVNQESRNAMADGLEAAVQSMHEQHLQSVQAIAEELQEYQLQSSEFEEELSTLERAVRGYSRKGQEGASELEERFRDANLHVVQDLPDRLFKLSQMAKDDRVPEPKRRGTGPTLSRRLLQPGPLQAKYRGKAGFSSDPLKRLESRIAALFQHSQTFLDQAEAQHDLYLLLDRLISTVALMGKG